MICNHCQSEIASSKAFCAKCGKPIDTISTKKSIKPITMFFRKYNGLIYLFVIFIVFLIIGITKLPTLVFAPSYINLLMRSIPYMIPLAFLVMLTIRTRGVDLSFLGYFGIYCILFNAINSFTIALILSIVFSVVFGLINSIIIHFGKIHATIATIITSMSLVLLNIYFADSITFKPYQFQVNGYTGILLAIVVLLIMYILLLPNTFSKKIFTNVSIVYTGSALLALLTYLLLTFRLRLPVAMSISSTQNIYLFVIMFACMITYMKRNIFALIVSLAVIFVSKYISQTLSAIGIVMYIQILIIYTIIIIGFIIMGRAGRNYFIRTDSIHASSIEKSMVWIPMITLILRGVLDVFVSTILQDSPDQMQILGRPIFIIMVLIVAIVCAVIYRQNLIKKSK